MNLYAFVQSERAIKGQGGQKFLDITINKMVNGKTTPFYMIKITQNELIVEDIRKGRELYRIKGEKQKGDVCKHCNKGGELVYNSVVMSEYCQLCGKWQNE